MQGQKSSKKILTPLPVLILQSLQTRAKVHCSPQAYIHSWTQPGEPGQGHSDGSEEAGPAASLQSHAPADVPNTDTASVQRGFIMSQPGELTEDECLHACFIQSCGILQLLSSSIQWACAYPAPLEAVKSIYFHVYTHSSKQLLFNSESSNCHLKWVPGYKMSTSTVTDATPFLSRTHPSRNSRSYGKIVRYEGAGSILLAFRLTVPPALPQNKLVWSWCSPGDRSRALPVVSLQDALSSPRLKVQAQGTSHRNHFNKLLNCVCKELVSLPCC